MILAKVFNGRLGFAKAHPSGPERPVAACLIFRFLKKYNCLTEDTDSNAQFLSALLEGFRATSSSLAKGKNNIGTDTVQLPRVLIQSVENLIHR